MFIWKNSGSINIGGGLLVYSIEEIKMTQDTPQTLPEFIPIGYLFENHLLISQTAVDRDCPAYLYIAGITLKPGLFLDRFVVSQGSIRIIISIR
jgi:hypothetical protein